MQQLRVSSEGEGPGVADVLMGRGDVAASRARAMHPEGAGGEHQRGEGSRSPAGCFTPSELLQASPSLAERGGKRHGGSLIRSGFGEVSSASHSIITAAPLQSDRPAATSAGSERGIPGRRSALREISSLIYWSS